MSEQEALHQDDREDCPTPPSNQGISMASGISISLPTSSTLPRADSAKGLQRLARLPPRKEPETEATSSTVPPPVLKQDQEPGVEVQAAAVDPIQTTKPVFSLFLTPDQRKQKQKQEAEASASDTSKGRRGRKPKPKSGVAQSLPASTPTPAASTPADVKPIVDPNISKTGETHRFFQEVRASKLLATESASGKGSEDESIWKKKRWHGVTPQSSRLPHQHEHFHGKETIDTINGVVARICGIDAYSPLSKPSATALDSLQSFSKGRARSSKLAHLKRDPDDLWYSLRSAPDLGITAPDIKLKSAGGDTWTHWRSTKPMKSSGTDGVPSTSTGESPLIDRESVFREWAERPTRLYRPSARDRDILSHHSDPVEFESCQRLAPDQPLWNQTWATALLSTPSTATMTCDSPTTAPRTILPSAMELPPELKVGELWTEKYRPTQGVEVLGNRANTEYLTQWLRGLEVSGWTLNPEEQTATVSTVTANAGAAGARKRRPPKRARRKDLADLDDFIVYGDDADDFEDPYGNSGYVSEDENYEFFGVVKPISSLSQVVRPEMAVKENDPVMGELGTSRILPKQFDIKSNTILLSGPIGSGKTAAVYACAEESGYEVFEVSPGTRRTGKDLLGLVGEMAENHHVHVVAGGRTAVTEDINHAVSNAAHSQGSTPAVAPTPVKSTIQSFFQQQQKQQAPESISTEDSEMADATEIDIEGDSTDSGEDYSRVAFTKAQNSTPTLETRISQSPSTQCSSPSASPSKSAMDEDFKKESVNDDLAFHEDTLSDLYSLLATTNPRQSLILLEEVDVLFEEDKGFWSSVMTLLAKSKRPVVMTCNDTSKIPPMTLRFQEHLEFTRPSLPELHHYLSAVCRIEGFICSSEYITALIRQQGRHDVRKCLMQLQYDAGLTRKRRLSPYSTPTTIEARSRSPAEQVSPLEEVASTPSQSVTPVVETPPSPSPVAASPSRRRPLRLLRISVRGIVPATAPTSSSRPSSPTPAVNLDDSGHPTTTAVPQIQHVDQTAVQELEKLEAQGRYTEAMSLSDASLRMTAARVFQCYEIDQFAVSKDDVIGQQHSSIWKRPSGADHLYLDQELASLFENGIESLQSFKDNHVSLFEDSIKREDPERALAEHFIPLSDDMSRALLRMQPALEQILSIQALRFQLRSAFSLYAPALRAMLQAQELNTMVPLGKRTMRSGGHLRRHLQMLSDQEAACLLSTAFESHRY
ncbi:hypothetical protein EMPS_06680 [Entomortierella parvispora]|uniref:AAA+ ATPase domain-containing protein n=1 Tax=Entomortierella parvispora TaxID=205924 RepID=A0A9P3HCX4_9FUNG|nr:hypothetical protein EMPS_06680 [Entomortierella parvispora]